MQSRRGTEGDFGAAGRSPRWSDGAGPKRGGKDPPCVEASPARSTPATEAVPCKGIAKNSHASDRSSKKADGEDRLDYGFLVFDCLVTDEDAGEVSP